MESNRFYKKWDIFEGSSKLFQWSFLILVLFLIGFLLFITLRYVYIIPAVLSSFYLAFLSISLEWIVLDLPLQSSSFKNSRSLSWSLLFVCYVSCLKLRIFIKRSTQHKRKLVAVCALYDKIMAST